MENLLVNDFNLSGCSFAKAGPIPDLVDSNQARVHLNPFSSNLRTSPKANKVAVNERADEAV